MGAPPLTLTEVTLTVQETKLQCFGAAGCNVEFRITAAIPRTVPAGVTHEVTYSLSGLVDAQIGTLTLDDQGEAVNATGYGQKARSKTRITATTTAVRRLT